MLSSSPRNESLLAKIRWVCFFTRSGEMCHWFRYCTCIQWHYRLQVETSVCTSTFCCFLDVQSQIVLRTPHHQPLYLLSVGRLIASCDQPHHSRIVREWDNGVSVVRWCTLCVQRIEKRAEHTAQWDSCADCQSWGTMWVRSHGLWPLC